MHTISLSAVPRVDGPAIAPVPDLSGMNAKIDMTPLFSGGVQQTLETLEPPERRVMLSALTAQLTNELYEIAVNRGRVIGPRAELSDGSLHACPAVNNRYSLSLRIASGTLELGGPGSRKHTDETKYVSARFGIDVNCKPHDFCHGYHARMKHVVYAHYPGGALERLGKFPEVLDEHPFVTLERSFSAASCLDKRRFFEQALTHNDAVSVSGLGDEDPVNAVCSGRLSMAEYLARAAYIMTPWHVPAVPLRIQDAVARGAIGFSDVFATS